MFPRIINESKSETDTADKFSLFNNTKEFNIPFGISFYDYESNVSILLILN